MAKIKDFGPRRYHRDNFENKFDINDDIRADEVLLVTEEGENLGKKSKKEALELAREKDKDLVIIAEKSNPPVAKIIDFSKFKYEQQKKKKNSSKGKAPEMKEMWFKAFIGDGDIDHKLKKVREFIEDNHPVKLTVKRKRYVSREQLDELMKKLLERVEEYSKVTNYPKLSGPNYSAIIAPK